MNDTRTIPDETPGHEPDSMRAYVNERGVSVPRGATALDAVQAFDPDAASAIREGSQRLTDSRGLPIASDTPVHGGAIYRLLPVRQGLAASAGEASGAGDAA